jgi:hypothetical protein
MKLSLRTTSVRNYCPKSFKRNVCADVIAGLLVVLPSPAQVRSGSLVVIIVSEHADYVVIGAESRRRDPSRNVVDDRGCKVISLGGDTLFYETGAAEIGVRRGKPWSSEGTARTVYVSSQKRDALNLSSAWGTRALRWFYPQPVQDLRAIAYGPNGSLANGGFINFDENGSLSVHSVEISYDAAKRTLTAQPSSQAPGQIGIAGVARDLVIEFFDGETDRAIKAFGPVGMVRLIAVDAMDDVSLVRKAIRFAMDNGSAQERLALGGDIDIAIIRRDQTIQWITRKSWCSQQDQRATPPLKHK